MRLGIISVTFTVSYSALAWGADLSPETLAICKAVYVDGSRNILSYSSDVNKARDYLDGVCSIKASNHDEFQKKRQKIDSSGDTPWGLYKFKWTEDKDAGKFQSEFASFCAQTKDASFLREFVRTSSSTIDKYLGDAFNQCVRTISDYATSQKHDVFQTYAFQPGPAEGLNFSVYVTFNPAITSQKLEVTSVSPEAVKCRYAGEVVGKTTVFESSSTKQEFTLDCERPTNQALVFTLGAMGMSTNKLSIPMRNDPLPELKSQLNELAIEIASLRKRQDGLRLTFTEGPVFKYSQNQNGVPGQPNYVAAFWGPVPTYPVIGDCPADHVLTGVQFDMLGDKGVRTPTRVQFSCQKVGLAAAIGPN